MADGFTAKRKAGLVAGHGSGYGGSGFKFNEEEEDKAKKVCVVMSSPVAVLKSSHVPAQCSLPAEQCAIAPGPTLTRRV